MKLTHLPVILLLCGMARSQTVNSSTVPFQLIGNTIVIQAGTNESNGYFLLDSGSPHLILDTKHVTNQRKDPTGFYSTDLSGSTKTTLSKTSVHLKVGDIEKRNQIAFLIDLGPIEKSKGIDLLGIIGYKFLKHFETVIDYLRKEITFFPLDRKGDRITPSELHTYPDQIFALKKSRHFLYLEALVNEETLKLGLDFGAEISVINKNTVRKFKKSFAPSHGATLVTFNGKRSGVNVGTLQQVYIGNTAVDLEAIVTNLDAINQNLVKKLDGLLGNGFLSRHKIAVNYKKQTLSIWDPAWYAQK